MKELSTDLDRDNFDYPNDKQETIIRIVGMATCFLLGVVFGAILFMGLMYGQDIPCIAGKTCSEHGEFRIKK